MLISWLLEILSDSSWTGADQISRDWWSSDVILMSWTTAGAVRNVEMRLVPIPGFRISSVSGQS